MRYSFVTSPLVDVRSIAIRVSICLSVCLSVYPLVFLEEHVCPKFTKFSVHVTCGRKPVLLCRQCNTLCTSGFLDYRPTCHPSRQRMHSSAPDAVSTLRIGRGRHNRDLQWQQNYAPGRSLLSTIAVFVLNSEWFLYLYISHFLVSPYCRFSLMLQLHSVSCYVGLV